MGTDDLATRLGRQFGEVLNRHGYGFQNAIVRRAAELHRLGQSMWFPLAQEVPVEVRGQSTRLDCVLERLSIVTPTVTRTYMVVECKRVNPKLGYWCFAKSSFIPHIEQATLPCIEILDGRGASPPLFGIEQITWKHEIYHVARELKTDASGEAQGESRGAIEDAMTQVCKGLNGFMNLLSDHWREAGMSEAARLVPVVFTTARLWVTDADIGQASLEDGNVDPFKVGLREVPFVFFHYPQSPGITHEFAPLNPTPKLLDTLYISFVRTIVVASQAGIDDILKEGILGP